MDLLIELLAQFVCEALAQVWLRMAGGSRDPDRPPSLWLPVPRYLLLGALAGALSAALLPRHLISTPTLRVVYLVVGPVAIGAAIAAIGSWVRRRGGRSANIDRFLYAWLFALAFTLVRYFAPE